MVVAIPLISVAEIASKLGSLMESVGPLRKIFQREEVNLAESLRELLQGTHQGAFHTVYSLNGEGISAEQVQEYFGEENIICVKRCCCSLTGWFPSGVFTVGSWLLTGTAVRHEFVILHTTNLVILIELSFDEENKNPMTSIIIRSARSNAEKIKAEKELLQKKWYVRTMTQLEGTKLGQLQFHQTISLVSVWILASRAGCNNFTVIQKNCKSLARSILYFSKESIDYWDVLYSLLQIFTDKPFQIFYHPTVIPGGKIAFNAIYLQSTDLKELAQCLIDLLKRIRVGQIVDEDIEYVYH